MDADSKRLRAIVAAIAAVPAGQVASYGGIARRAGFPGRARLVARILASGEHPGLPWHRILRSDGRIAFPPGSAAFIEQSARLEAEGVPVCSGRVRLVPVGGSDLDRMIWG